MTWLGLIRGYRNKEVLEESTCIYISSLGISLISGNTSGIDRAGFDEKFRLCKMVIISSSTSMGLIFDFNMSCHFILADNNNKDKGVKIWLNFTISCISMTKVSQGEKIPLNLGSRCKTMISVNYDGVDR